MPSSRPELTRRLSAVAALLSATMGAIVFVGWAADIEVFRRVFVSNVHMLPNTSVGFMAGGAALWLLHRKDRAPAFVLVGRLLATIVLALGLITFVERVTDWNAGIDMLLFPDLVRQHRYVPYGRMAANSTVAFTLAGIALLTLDVVPSRGWRPTSVASTIGLAIGSIAMVGYLYDAQNLYLGDVATGMALATAVSFLILHSGILLARPSGGVALLFGRSDAGMLARRTLIGVILVPLLFGKIVLSAQQHALVTGETAIAVFVVTVIGIVTVIAIRGALEAQAGEQSRAAAHEREIAAREEAEAAVRAKNDFLAVMSHELRTPLNAIIGYTSLLDDGIPDPVTDAQRRHLARIGSSARHLLALIEEVLTLSRMELGEEQLAPTDVSVRQVMEDAAAMVEPQALAKGLVFELQSPERVLSIQTDAKKLRQALLNLLGNAVKFTEAGSIVFRVLESPTEQHLVFEVEDTGPGISDEHLERVFESFWQADQALSRRSGGVGLGLHVTRQLVRLLGGDVYVRSTPGEGSCFSVHLPRSWWGATTSEFARMTPASLEAHATPPAPLHSVS